MKHTTKQTEASAEEYDIRHTETPYPTKDADPESALHRLSEKRREALQTCVNALLDVQNAYQTHFDEMPVAWQTYDDIVTQALNAAGVLDTGDRQVKAPTKGKSAPLVAKTPPGKHTPDHELLGMIPGDIIEACELIHEWTMRNGFENWELCAVASRKLLRETAAERDRLASKVAGLEHAFSDIAKTHDKLEEERDRLREQVREFADLAVKAERQVKTLQQRTIEDFKDNL